MDELREIISFYQLVDPRDNQPFYVGQTIDMARRFKDYLNRPHHQGRVLALRLDELQMLGLQPVMQELEQRECTKEEASEREIYWMKTLESRGIALLNKSNAPRKKHQQTSYLPPALAKWLKIQAAKENREMSEIVTEALEEYRRTH